PPPRSHPPAPSPPPPPPSPHPSPEGCPPRRRRQPTAGRGAGGSGGRGGGPHVVAWHGGGPHGTWKWTWPTGLRWILASTLTQAPVKHVSPWAPFTHPAGWSLGMGRCLANHRRGAGRVIAPAAAGLPLSFSAGIGGRILSTILGLVLALGGGVDRLCPWTRTHIRPRIRQVRPAQPITWP